LISSEIAFDETTPAGGSADAYEARCVVAMANKYGWVTPSQDLCVGRPGGHHDMRIHIWCSDGSSICLRQDRQASRKLARQMSPLPDDLYPKGC